MACAPRRRAARWRPHDGHGQRARPSTAPRPTSPALTSPAGCSSGPWTQVSTWWPNRPERSGWGRSPIRSTLTTPASPPRWWSSPPARRDGRLGLDGEDSFAGHGISHCASCDAPLFAGEDVVLAGNGDWAVEEVLILAKYARGVTVVVPDERLSCARARRRRLDACDNVEVVASTRIVGLEADGANRLASVRLSRADRQWTAPARAVIPLIGQRPNTDIVPSRGSTRPGAATCSPRSPPPASPVCTLRAM